MILSDIKFRVFDRVNERVLEFKRPYRNEEYNMSLRPKYMKVVKVRIRLMESIINIIPILNFFGQDIDYDKYLEKYNEVKYNE